MHKPSPSCRTDKPSVDGLRFGLTIGGALIIMGSGFLLEKLGMLRGLEAWQVWPGILAWMGLLKIFVGRSVRHAVEGLILIGVAGAVGANYLGYIDLQWGMVWPVLLILVGVIIFMAAVGGTRKWSRKGKPRSSGDVRVPSSRSFVEGDVVLGSRAERIDSQEFEGGEIRCVMGGFNLDLRDAKIKGPEAVIRVKAVMGGIELYVPDDWNIVIQGNPMMGAFENKTRQRLSAQDADAPRLVIEGSVVMGGVEIGN